MHKCISDCNASSHSLARILSSVSLLLYFFSFSLSISLRARTHVRIILEARVHTRGVPTSSTCVRASARMRAARSIVSNPDAFDDKSSPGREREITDFHRKLKQSIRNCKKNVNRESPAMNSHSLCRNKMHRETTSRGAASDGAAPASPSRPSPGLEATPETPYAHLRMSYASTISFCRGIWRWVVVRCSYAGKTIRRISSEDTTSDNRYGIKRRSRPPRVVLCI